ncbi:MAG: tRNA 5-methoxyuridine(34)/uridine 5-oxyacetic acid(34) synthase CmoB [Xanthomonadales bacterium]|nr:tRNA 5-methoxyuridine(34)/uridine 5-oxyacetic acid(34) synthase CmoB [Xanthomonadales bacterium]
MKNPYLQLKDSHWPRLVELAWQRLESNTHGDLPRWLDAIRALPEGDGHSELGRNAPLLGRPLDDTQALRGQLMELHPWRKGPLELAGVRIDTEWRSDWKWDRLAPHLDLEGQQILDIGCGNGYFGLRMLGAGAKLVVGIDPTMVFVMQWLAMQKLGRGLNSYVLPLGIEDLPTDTGGFDTVFSMGVLYHRRKPVEHLEQLRKLARPGGQLLLETLIIDAEGKHSLSPEGRYARMRNVHAIPTIEMLQDWLRHAGMPDSLVLDTTQTTRQEQRSTDWMTFESLNECLDPRDRDLTIEGHPAPLRAMMLVKL